MKVTLESTTKVVEIIVEGQAVPARVWEGTTEGGVRCFALITRIAAAGRDAKGLDEFERDLQEHRPPTPDLQVFPLRLVL